MEFASKSPPFIVTRLASLGHVIWLKIDSKLGSTKQVGLFCADYLATRTDMLPIAIHKWRRVRDSNPRTLTSQWFSRPPHSTALPTLRYSPVKSTKTLGFYRAYSLF